MAIAPITYQPVSPARPIRRRRPETEEQAEEKRAEEASSGARTARPRFDLDDDSPEDFADPDRRRRSRGLALVSAQVTFQAQQYAQEHLGSGLHYEPWRDATQAYERWSRS